MLRLTRKLKPLLTLVLVASYLVVSLTGHALHHHSCCDYPNGNDSSVAAGNGAHCPDACGVPHQEVSLADAAGATRGLPGEQEEEDSSTDCWTCFMLSQVGYSSGQMSFSAGNDFVGTASTNWDALNLYAIPNVYLARGPPGFLLPQA